MALEAFYTMTATVETYLGVTPRGDGYAAPVTVRGFLNDGLVREETTAGEQLVQKSSWFGPIADAPLFRPESRFTVNGRSSQVTSVHRHEGGSLFTGIAHVEVDLT